MKNQEWVSRVSLPLFSFCIFFFFFSSTHIPFACIYFSCLHQGFFVCSTNLSALCVFRLQSSFTSLNLWGMKMSKESVGKGKRMKDGIRRILEQLVFRVFFSSSSSFPSFFSFSCFNPGLLKETCCVCCDCLTLCSFCWLCCLLLRLIHSVVVSLDDLIHLTHSECDFLPRRTQSSNWGKKCQQSSRSSFISIQSSCH